MSTPIFLHLVNGVELFSMKYLFSLVFLLKYKYYLSEENYPANENFILSPILEIFIEMSCLLKGNM